jgi:predicted transcriptional regulator of viral defense system
MLLILLAIFFYPSASIIPQIDINFKICQFVEMNLKAQKLMKRPFSYQQAVKVGLSKYELKKLMKQEAIERIERGIYAPTDYDVTDPEAQFQIATLKCSELSCICLLSALDAYHVTDQIPNKIWIMVPEHKRVRSSNLKLIRASNPRWDIGIVKEEGYRITSLERTLVESLLYKKYFGYPIPIEALKEALSQKKLRLGDVFIMAKQLGVVHHIQPYIETLAT